MNFGLVAIDRFRQMYREELAQRRRAWWPGEPSYKLKRMIG